MWEERMQLEFPDLDPDNKRHKLLYASDVVWSPASNGYQRACVRCKTLGHQAPECKQHQAFQKHMLNFMEEEE